MAEFLPIIIVGAIIGTFTVIFLTAYILEKKNKSTKEYERHMSDKEITARLLAYAKPYWKQFVAVLVIMLVSIVFNYLMALNIESPSLPDEPGAPSDPVALPRHSQF